MSQPSSTTKRAGQSRQEVTGGTAQPGMDSKSSGVGAFFIFDDLQRNKRCGSASGLDANHQTKPELLLRFSRSRDHAAHREIGEPQF